MNCIYYISWPILFFVNLFYFTLPVKINLNGLSFFHSVVTTILSKNYLHNLQSISLKNNLFHFSSSYFIWDTLQIIVRQRWKQEWAYLYHHFVCLFMLSKFYYDIDITLIATILFLGEFSNFFNYIVYHMIKSENYSEKNILIISILQLIWFTYFRVYKLTDFIIHNITKFDSYLLVFLLLTIYIMGFIWGWGQLRNTSKKIKQFMKKKDIKSISNVPMFS